MQSRCIMTPKNDDVQEINDIMLNKMPEPNQPIYRSIDTVPDDPNFEHFDLDWIHGLRCSGIPNHELKIKKYAPIMIMRNIDQRGGVCNGTKCIVDDVRPNSIVATIISGSNIGKR